MIGTPAKAPRLERLEVSAAGKSWLIDREGDLEALWSSLDNLDEDERLPYWVELWPSSLLLADWRGNNPQAVATLPVVDLGCGLGLVSMVAASLGARVLGLDYIPQALSYARRNARINAERHGFAPPRFAAMDWRAPAFPAGTFDLILAADVLYELRFIEPVLDFIQYALRPGGRAILADPQRSTWPHFLDRAAARGFDWNLLCLEQVTSATPPRTCCVAGVYELKPKEETR